jgi:hypothetical protein
MLFLQGTRDELAELRLLTAVVQSLGSRANLKVFTDADHSFHVRVRSGTNDEAVMRAMVSETSDWIFALANRPESRRVNAGR